MKPLTHAQGFKFNKLTISLIGGALALAGLYLAWKTFAAGGFGSKCPNANCGSEMSNSMGTVKVCKDKSEVFFYVKSKYTASFTTWFSVQNGKKTKKLTNKRALLVQPNEEIVKSRTRTAATKVNGVRFDIQFETSDGKKAQSTRPLTDIKNCSLG